MIIVGIGEVKSVWQELARILKISDNIHFVGFQKFSEAGVVVNLDGRGADELLAADFGYPHARIETLNQYPSRVLLQAFLKRFSDNLVSKCVV